jgi:flavodoxin
MNAKSIVYYYSRSGNTKLIAEHIAQTLGCESEALKDPVSYSGVIGFIKGGRDALKKVTPKIQSLVHNPAAYELIVIGQPVWAARPVPAVNGLIKQYNLAGKNVALFVTFDGGGDARCLETTAGMLPAANVVARTSFLKVGRHRDTNLQKAREWAQSLSASAKHA